MSKFYTKEYPIVFTWEIDKFYLSSICSIDTSIFTACGLHFWMTYSLGIVKLYCCDTFKISPPIRLNYSYQVNCNNGDNLKVDEGIINTDNFGDETYKIWCCCSLNYSEFLENRAKYLSNERLSVLLTVWGKLLRVSNLIQILFKSKSKKFECCFEVKLSLARLKSPQKCVFKTVENSYEFSFEITHEEKIKIIAKQIKGNISMIFTYNICVIYSGFQKKFHYKKILFDKEHLCHTFISPFTISEFPILATNDVRVVCEVHRICYLIGNCEVTHILEELPTMTVYEETSQINQLQNNFINMYKSEQLEDVTLQVGGEKIESHKFVLAAQSPVFKSKFQDNMIKKKRSSIIKIDDLTFETVDEMLKFMYGGNLQDLNCEKTMQLMYAAEKYKIDSLKEYSSSFLRLNMSVENACQILTAANIVHDDALKTLAIKFLQCHKEQILRSDQWAEIVKNHPQLTIEVLTAFVSHQ